MKIQIGLYAEKFSSVYVKLHTNIFVYGDESVSTFCFRKTHSCRGIKDRK